MQRIRDIFFFMFGIGFLALFVLFTLLGGLCLVIAPLKYDWMIAHEMFKHAYAFAALCIFGEIVYLFMLRHGIILLLDLFKAMFVGEKHEHVAG